MKKNRYVQAIWLAGAAWLAGCASPRTGTIVAPFVDREFMFLSPKELKEELTYPPGVTTEKLTWEADQFRWQVRFPAQGYAYAALRFRYRNDRSACFDHGDLTFRVTPAAAAGQLAIALVDGTNRPPRVMVTRPVVATPARRNGSAATVRIPLTDFPTHGVAIEDPGGSPPMAFDPSDLREIRLIAPDGVRNGPVTITELRIEH